MPDRFLIANFKTGLDRSLQPFLVMKDAYTDVSNYRVFRGVIQPRRGVSGFATGGFGGKPSEDSRIYSQKSETVTDTNQTFSHTLSITPVRKASITITDSSGTPQVLTDDGAGNMTGDGTGTVNYDTGVINATWTAAPTAPITAVFEYPNKKSVMGIFNFISSDNTRKLLVVSENEFNVYNSTTNRFDIIPIRSGSSALRPTGSNKDFFSGTMYPDKNGSPRFIFVNNISADLIYSFDGTDISLFNDAADNPDYANPIGETLLSCLHVFYFGERLVCLRPITTNTSGTAVRPQRILWTAINNSAGDGDKFNSPGSGYLDIPTESWITAAVKLKNQIIIYTEESVWSLSVTPNIDLPFRLEQIGDAESRGSQAPFSGVTWFGQSAAVGQAGIIGTDGARAYRIDNKIPYFTFNKIMGLQPSSSNSPLDYVTSGTVYELSEFWFPYADFEDDENFSTRVLAHNFEEGSWSEYDIDISVLGKFKEQNETAWDDVNGDTNPEWSTWDSTTKIWDSFLEQKFSFISLVGDQNGFINKIQSKNDQDFKITDITFGTSTVVTCNSETISVGDKVKIEGVVGFLINGKSPVNGKVFEVTAKTSTNITINLDSTGATAFDPVNSNATVSKIIKRELKFKPFNPYLEQGLKCRLKRVWFFIDTNTSIFYIDLYADRRGEPYREKIPVASTDTEGGAIKKWTSITVNQVANFHTIRIYSDDSNASEKIHAILYETDPVGRLIR